MFIICTIYMYIYIYIPYIYIYIPYIYIYIYTDRKEIEVCKKLIYSYSTRLAFDILGFYLLTIFNYFTVVPSSGELPLTYSWDLQLKHQSVTYFGWKLPVTYVKICYKSVYVQLPCQNRKNVHTPPVKVKTSRHN